jgi:ketosteroid isomerase-like protein
MSRENVDLVRRSLDHFDATGEFLWDAIDPGVEWVIDPIGLLAGTYRGHEGVKMFLARIEEGFDQVRFEIDNLIDAGDSVVALGRTRMHGRGSGVTVEQPIGWVLRVRESRIVRSQVYFRPSEALQAVGLADG